MARQVVLTPADVKEAIERGIDHVLSNNTSYILDMRIASNTPAIQIKSGDTTFMVDKRYALQPMLNAFHENALQNNASLKKGGSAEDESTHYNIPSLF